MADRYWVGGAGTWDATTTTNWSATSGGAGGASAPTSVDNVIFNSASNATLYTVTIGTNAVCNDLTAAGPLSGNVTFSLGATARLDPYGSMTLPATGLTWSASNGALVTFRATTTGKTVTTNGVSLIATNITFNGVGGGWTLGSALTYGTAQTLIIANGTFNSGNFSITGNVFGINVVGTQVVNLGSSTVSLSGNFTISQTAGLSFNAGTSQINCSNVNTAFAGGAQTFYNVSFTGAAAGTTNITGINTFNDLTQISRSVTGIRTVSLGANQTVSGTLTLGAANTSIRRIQVQSDIIGTQRTITLNGTLAALADVDFRNIATAGSVGTWTGTRLGNGLGNSGITFTAAKDVYWNLAAGGSWSATGWALSSGGAVDANNFPLSQDRAIIENTGLNTSATIALDTGWWIGELDLSTRSNAMTFNGGNTQPQAYKNVTLSSAVTTAGTTAAWRFAGQGTTQILDFNTATFIQSINIDSPSGTVQLAENATCSATVTLTSGTLDVNGKVLSVGLFSSANTNTRTLTLGTSGTLAITNGNWTAPTATGLTLSGTGTISMDLATAKTFAGGGLVYPYALNQGGAGTLTITGANTFANITNTVQPCTITFPASTTTTVSDFNVNGTAGNLVTLNSSIPGTRFTLLKV